jgi:TatD DNase family protein
MRYIDSHAHIYLPQFDEDREEMMSRTLESGVDRIVMPNIDHTSIDPMMELEERYPDHCFATMGVHPCSIRKDFESELYRTEDWLGKRSFKGIGETGIDLYWDKSFLEQQKESLRIHIEWSKKYKIPIILHCRDSFEETIEIIEELNDESLKGVFHCFTGSVEDAKRVLALDGFYLGIGGVATFKNGGLDKVLPEIDPDRIILETDSPYLAPVPYRGKRNESSYIPLIAERITELTEIGLEEVAVRTTQSSSELFEL